jgi:hypothetical protein
MAEDLRRMVQAMLDQVVAGPGIRIERAGNQTVIHNSLWPMCHGGGGASIIPCTTFPDIPAAYTLISIEGQIWAAGPDDDAWYPLYKFTDTEGEPETTP